MSSIPSSSGKSKPEIKKGAVVSTARFVSQFMVGKELEPLTSVNNRQRLRDNHIEVTYFNDTFMQVYFPKSDYVQFIPWSAVATVIFE